MWQSKKMGGERVQNAAGNVQGKGCAAPPRQGICERRSEFDSTRGCEVPAVAFGPQERVQRLAREILRDDAKMRRFGARPQQQHNRRMADQDKQRVSNNHSFTRKRGHCRQYRSLASMPTSARNTSINSASPMMSSNFFTATVVWRQIALRT